MQPGHPVLCGCLACRPAAGYEIQSAAPVQAAASGGEAVMAAISGSHYIDALLSPDQFRWTYDAAGTPITLSYGFMTTMPWYVASFGYESGPFEPFTVVQQDGVERAVALFEQVANIDFVYRADGDNAQVRFGSAVLGDREAAHTYYPDPFGDWAGDVWFNVNDWSVTDQSAGSYGFLVTMHEMGHALGLKHPFDDGTSSGAVLSAGEDSRQHTVMSYSAPATMSDVEAASLMLYDIAALQYLYGVNTSYRSGDDTWRWGQDETFRVCVWDAGGNDAIDASNQIRRAIINLNPGTFSSLGSYSSGDATDNLSIAFNCWIEDAAGGSGDDTLVGNRLANRLAAGAGDDRLDGGSGDDVLDGGGGTDVAVFGGNRSEYQIDRGDGSLIITDLRPLAASDGRDLLFDVERLQFADQLVVANDAPQVSAIDPLLVHGMSAVTASALFAVADRDGDAIARYAFLDATEGGGSFSVNGVASAANQRIEVAASDLSSVQFLFGAPASADLVSIAAYDGLAWSDWESFTISAPANTAPVVTATDCAVGINATVSVATLLSASDADHDSIAQYRFWDSTPGGGAFRINGVTQRAFGSVDVMADQLAVTEFLTGSSAGSDLLWAQAFDGNAWSSWTPFTVTTLASN